MSNVDRTDALLAAQRTYYDLRAPEYRAEPSDRKVPGHPTHDDVAQAVEKFAPSRDVLELACGDGIFTRELARHAASVTAVDASPQMLERNAALSTGLAVDYIESDLFSWQP